MDRFNIWPLQLTHFEAEGDLSCCLDCLNPSFWAVDTCLLRLSINVSPFVTLNILSFAYLHLLHICTCLPLCPCLIPALCLPFFLLRHSWIRQWLFFPVLLTRIHFCRTKKYFLGYLCSFWPWIVGQWFFLFIFFCHLYCNMGKRTSQPLGHSPAVQQSWRVTVEGERVSSPWSHCLRYWDLLMGNTW